MAYFPTRWGDVPIHRDSVTAMHTAIATDEARPLHDYTWGASKPSLRPDIPFVRLDPDTLLPKPEPMRKRKPKRKPKPRVSRNRVPDYEAGRAAAQEAGRRLIDISDPSTWGAREPTTATQPPSPARPAPSRHPRPAAGWKPLSGADLDDLLGGNDAAS